MSDVMVDCVADANFARAGINGFPYVVCVAQKHVDRSLVHAMLLARKMLVNGLPWMEIIHNT